MLGDRPRRKCRCLKTLPGKRRGLVGASGRLLVLVSLQYAPEPLHRRRAWGARQLLERARVTGIHPERLLVHFSSACIHAAFFVKLAERNHRLRVEMLRFQNFQKMLFCPVAPPRVLSECESEQAMIFRIRTV